MFKPDETKTTETLIFSRRTITDGIRLDLEKQGYSGIKMVWNETGTKLEVTADKKGGK
jgi:hypothetical protein